MNYDETIYLNDLVSAVPYYISAIIRSFYEQKDLTKKEGLLSTLEYEVRKGDIFATWMEYILNTIDDRNGKKILIFYIKIEKKNRPERK